MAPTESGRPSRGRLWWEWLQTLLASLLIFLFLQAFVIQAFAVDGPSMLPTLHTGDRIMANKFIYRFHPPAVGDIVVLDDPVFRRKALVKRVVAVEGQRVARVNGRYLVDGEPIGAACRFPFPTEDVEGNVPAGHLFVMGDNDCQSRDSRSFGPVPLDQVRGKVMLRFWPPRFFGLLDGDRPGGIRPGGSGSGSASETRSGGRVDTPPGDLYNVQGT